MVPRAAPPESASAAIGARSDDAHQGDAIPAEKAPREPLAMRLREAWNSPDDLHAVIVAAVQRGLYTECLDAVRQLMRIDPDAERSHRLAGDVMARAGNFNEAEAAFERYLRRGGQSATILAARAELHLARGDRHRAMDDFWRAVKLDPEHTAAVDGYAQLQRALGGEAGYLVALKRLAESGSQLASQWLAQHRSVPAR